MMSEVAADGGRKLTHEVRRLPPDCSEVSMALVHGSRAAAVALQQVHCACMAGHIPKPLGETKSSLISFLY